MTTMTTEIEAFDTIELTCDLPKFGLGKGTQGKVYDVRQPNVLFEVEFEGQPNNVLISIRQCKKVNL